MTELTHQYLLDNLKYDAEAGILTWRLAGKGRRMGKPLGSDKGNGYLTVRILGLQYMLHRVIWFYCKGEWPKNDIDHEDQNKHNNRIGNLRDFTKTLNNQNLKTAKSSSKLGILGVRQVKGKFHANIGVNSKSVYLGSFDTIEEATEAYQAGKVKYHAGALNAIS